MAEPARSRDPFAERIGQARAALGPRRPSAPSVADPGNGFDRAVEDFRQREVKLEQELDRLRTALLALKDAVRVALEDDPQPSPKAPDPRTNPHTTMDAEVWRARDVRADLVRQTLTDDLTPTLAELDPVPHASIEQAKRRARLRTKLLASGAFTHPAIAEGRGQSITAARQWVHRARERAAIFTVKHDGETLVPAFLLDQDLEPRPQFAPAITALRAVGEDGWALWAWFTLPSGWLDGRVPAEHALVDADAVTRAAERRASNAA